MGKIRRCKKHEKIKHRVDKEENLRRRAVKRGDQKMGRQKDKEDEKRGAGKQPRGASGGKIRIKGK